MPRPSSYSRRTDRSSGPAMLAADAGVGRQRSTKHAGDECESRRRVGSVTMQKRLDAFNGRDPGKAWAWFVQGTRMVTPADFERLVGRA